VMLNGQTAAQMSGQQLREMIEEVEEALQHLS